MCVHATPLLILTHNRTIQINLDRNHLCKWIGINLDLIRIRWMLIQCGCVQSGYNPVQCTLNVQCKQSVWVYQLLLILNSWIPANESLIKYDHVFLLWNWQIHQATHMTIVHLVLRNLPWSASMYSGHNFDWVTTAFYYGFKLLMPCWWWKVICLNLRKSIDEWYIGHTFELAVSWPVWKALSYEKGCHTQ